MATGEFPISVVLRAVDEVTKPLKKINRRIDKLVSPIRRTNNAFRLLSREAGLGRLANSVRGVGRATGRVAGEVGGLVKKFALLGTVAAGGLFAAVRSQARLGDSVSKTATKLGIGIEALQEYRFAAERSGVNIATFDMAMQRFGRRVGEAANGMGEARTALKTLGISVRDTTGSVRSLESLLPEIADKLSKVESENVRNALAMKFFDSEGVALVNMLEDGSEGMEKLRSEARKLGLVMSETTIKDSVKFTDAMTDISSALLGVRNVVGGELLPVFTDIIKEITEFAVGNQDKIRAFSKNFAVKIPNALRKTRDVLGELSQMAKPVIDIVTRITDRFGVANTIGAVLAVTIGGKLLLAVVALTQAFGVLGLSTIKPLLSLFLIFKHITGAVLVKSLFQLGLSLSLIVPKIIAVGSAFMATPMGAILGIIALLAGGAFLIIKKWEPIKEFFKSLWDGIKKGFLSMLRFF